MTTLERRTPFDSTSAAGAMLMRQMREPVLVGCMLAGLGTTTANTLPRDVVRRSQRVLEQTTAGTVLPSIEPAGAAIGELRRLSGLRAARLVSWIPSTEFGSGSAAPDLANLATTTRSVFDPVLRNSFNLGASLAVNQQAAFAVFSPPDLLTLPANNLRTRVEALRARLWRAREAGAHQQMRLAPPHGARDEAQPRGAGEFRQRGPRFGVASGDDDAIPAPAPIGFQHQRKAEGGNGAVQIGGIVQRDGVGGGRAGLCGPAQEIIARRQRGKGVRIAAGTREQRCQVRTRARQPPQQFRHQVVARHHQIRQGRRNSVRQ